MKKLQITIKSNFDEAKNIIENGYCLSSLGQWNGQTFTINEPYDETDDFQAASHKDLNEMISDDLTQCGCDFILRDIEATKYSDEVKEINGIKYREYSHEGADDYTVTVRVKVNPYVAGVFLNVLKDTLREICCGAYDKGNGIIDVDFIEVFPFNKALDEVSEKTEIKYQFLNPEEI